MPERIQRQRTKGWRIPECAIYVGRPTMWGNPFAVDGCRVHGVGWTLVFRTPEQARAASVDMFSRLVRGSWNPGVAAALTDSQYRDLADGLQRWRRRIGMHPATAAHLDLGGRDLACWCPLNRPCHADVLLEIANGGIH